MVVVVNAINGNSVLWEAVDEDVDIALWRQCVFGTNEQHHISILEIVNKFLDGIILLGLALSLQCGESASLHILIPMLNVDRSSATDVVDGHHGHAGWVDVWLLINTNNKLDKSPGKSWEQLDKSWTNFHDNVCQKAAARLEPQDRLQIVDQEIVDAVLDREVDEGAGLVADEHYWGKCGHCLDLRPNVIMQNIGQPELCRALRVANID